MCASAESTQSVRKMPFLHLFLIPPSASQVETLNQSGSHPDVHSVFSLFLSSFIETYYTYHTICSLKMYHSIAFRMLYNYHRGQFWNIFIIPKDRPHPSEYSLDTQIWINQFSEGKEHSLDCFYLVFN